MQKAARSNDTTDMPAGLETGRGREAVSPSEIPARGWLDIAWRIWGKIGTDRVLLIAAGATFYLLLALFPALAAFVSIYGFVADPTTIADHIAFLGGILPTGGFEMIRTQLEALADQNEAALSWGFITGLAVALWSANNGIKSLFEGLNVAYDETEKRSFLWLNLVSFGFTLGALLIAMMLISAVGVIPAVLAVLQLDHWSALLVDLMRWPLLLVMIGIGISLIFRYGPSREPAKWRWITPGAVLATLVWVIASWGFSLYLSNFADYNATYGSLGAVIGFMMWTWISVVILMVGAEINSEMEHQTARDSTTGDPLPIGQRGATMADTIGKVAE